MRRSANFKNSNLSGRAQVMVGSTQSFVQIAGGILLSILLLVLPQDVRAQGPLGAVGGMSTGAVLDAAQSRVDHVTSNAANDASLVVAQAARNVDLLIQSIRLS